MERSKRTLSLADRLQELLSDISGLFQDEVVLTLITRSIDTPDGSRDTCVTNDPDRAALIEAVHRLWRDPSQGAGLSEAINRQLQS